MKKYLEAILVAFLAIWLVAGCNGDNDDKDTTEDVTPDPTEDEVTGDPTEDPTPDPTPDTTPDTTPDVTPDPTEDTVEDTIEDTVEEEAETCPEDDPPDHIYVDVDGGLMPIGTEVVEGHFVAGISPLDALTEPVPTPIGDPTTTDASGLWSLLCRDVGPVDLGFVILVDDAAADGIAGDLYPTGTGVQSWLTPAQKVDVTGATAVTVSNTVMAGLEALLTDALDADTSGLIMGVVLDGSATPPTPLSGAVIVNTGEGSALDVYYPSPTFDSVAAEATTASGLFVIPGPRTLTDTNNTAELTGYTFDIHQAATKGGFIYFQMVVGVPEE